MRRPYDYGLPGDVSYTPQNRIKELYFGPTSEAAMRSVPSGSHMAPIGKTVGLNGRRGMGQLFAVPLEEVTGRPVMRAAYEMGRLGCPTAIGMAALGDAAADRAACLAATGAASGGAGVASQMHTQSGGTDQGWTTGISVFSALASTAQAMCGLISTGSDVATAPSGPTPPPLPAGTSSLYSQPNQPAPSSGFLAGVPNWAILAGAVAVGGLTAAIVFGGK